MPDFNDRMKDYVQVNERILAFTERYPDGSLQAELVSLDDKLVVMRAYAYRTPEDKRPGIGYSSLQIPGTTPYTKGSEIENCETSAWGRAIAALGFEVKRGIASQEEVRNKHQDEPPKRPAAASNNAPSQQARAARVTTMQQAAQAPAKAPELDASKIRTARQLVAAAEASYSWDQAKVFSILNVTDADGLRVLVGKDGLEKVVADLKLYRVSVDPPGAGDGMGGHLLDEALALGATPVEGEEFPPLTDEDKPF